jgi:stage V sporulation protein K
MESIYGLKKLSDSVERSKVVIMDLSYRHKYNTRQKSQIKTFLADIRNGKFSQTTFIFYGSIPNVEDFRENYPTFNAIVQEIGTFLLSIFHLEHNTWELCAWLSQEEQVREGLKSLPTEENKPEPYEKVVEEATEEKDDSSEITDAERQLSEMVGLERMKREVNDARNMAIFNLRRYELNLSDATDNRHHMLFLGNPGTGKTTVAKLIGTMYQNLGILTNGHTIEVNRSNLIGEYIGQTEARTKSYIEKARGGVLFIDEAYSLFSDSCSTNDFGKQVLNTLLPILAEPNPNMIIIMAGYEDKINYMLNSNQGLRERFPISIHFDDYTSDELWDIAHYICAKRGFVLTPEADERLHQYIANETKKRTPSFSNARWVNNLMYQGVIKNMASRVVAATSETDLNRLYTTIEESDIIKGEQEFNVHNPSTAERNRIGFA